MDKKKETKINTPLEKETLMQPMNKDKRTQLLSPVALICVSGAILLGIGSGYFLASRGNLSSTTSMSPGSTIEEGTVVGSNDTKTFKDSAEGILEEGGIEGEGQYHLVRPGGVSQNVYLTSSTVDLSAFIKKKVRVRGETNKGQKAGWLMDVGRVEVLQ